jgi:hypothetical protein
VISGFLPRNELNYVGQAGMKLSFNHFALDFMAED